MINQVEPQHPGLGIRVRPISQHDHEHHHHDDNNGTEALHGNVHDHHDHDHDHDHEHHHHHSGDHDQHQNPDHSHDHHDHQDHAHSQTQELIDAVPKGHLGLEKQFNTLLDDVKEFVHNYNELGFKAYRELVKEFSEENLVTSPFGLSSILSALFLGTRGQTAEELDRLLKLDQPRSFNAHLFNRNLTADLVNDPHLNAAVIHELFVQLSKGPPLGFYKSMLNHFYGAHVDRIPFRSATAAVKSFTEQRIRMQKEQSRLRLVSMSSSPDHDEVDLNRYRFHAAGSPHGSSSQQTTHMLADGEEDFKYREMYEARILSPLILADLRVRPPLSVVNVNSFHGKWKWENSTTLLDAYDFIKLPTTHRRLVKVIGIEQVADLYIGYDQESDVTLVEMPYSTGDFGLVLMLPGEPSSFSRSGIRQLEEQLTADKLGRMLRKMVIRRTRVRLPVMSNKFVLHLEDVLGILGANTMFDSNLADFSGVNGLTDLHLKDIVQVNEFTITQTVTEKVHPSTNYSQQVQHEPVATAREPKQDPSYSVNKEEPKFTVNFNRDFLYAVRHHPTGILIHLGRYVNPFT
ncbi:unnamed protein product [Notodromas monacha]|uniref:Serpin domain-containing protein n=1 Tax=Notodromas monacha TaxID=399045 RepID=A0A7R9BP01_9CRUS|nr:unnamed protein product [Notodromas monacha]CAG0919002.1 unnamed protein product [Notodromas monacha]